MSSNGETSVDSVVASVIASFQKRSADGLKKYGKTLDRKDLSFLDWVQHTQEELMDAVLYLEKLKEPAGLLNVLKPSESDGEIVESVSVEPVKKKSKREPKPKAEKADEASSEAVVVSEKPKPKAKGKTVVTVEA